MAEKIDHDAPQTLGQDTTLLGRGKYLTMTVCGGCHGGPELNGVDDPNMKSPPLLIAASYTNEQFRHLLGTGEGNRKKDCGVMSEVAKGFLHKLTDSEKNAIHAYLLTRI